MTTEAPPATAMRFSVDTWDPGYGSSLQLEEDLEESSARIDVEVEVPAGSWRPIEAPSGLAVPDRLLFVDGVRRIDARAWLLDEDAGTSMALCASYAAGVVCCCPGQAHVVRAETRRGLFTAAGRAEDVVTRAGTWRAAHATARAGQSLPVALSATLQNRLAELEVLVAGQARALVSDHAGGDDDLLVVDGPLRGRTHLPRALGMIKTHRTAYLAGDQQAVVDALAPGERTPVFHMGTSWERRSWYLRLPGGGASPWAGVVRVECSADLPATTAVALAGLSQLTLGRYASTEYKDPRAPQNLYPVAGLERELRRRLGDPRVLVRALRAAASTGVRAAGQPVPPAADRGEAYR